MIILLTILKIIGILLLVLLGILVVLAVLVVFVPVRYRVDTCRREGGASPMAAEVKITWLLHIVNAAISYPEAPYIRVRLFCFTLFRSDKERAGQKEALGQQGEKPIEAPKPEAVNEKVESAPKKAPGISPEKPVSPEKAEKKENQAQEGHKEEAGEETAGRNLGIIEKLLEFFSRLLGIIKNIRYTIRRICDKIKDIVNNIQYYSNILKSDVFQRTWTLCSGQVLALLKSIRPRKFTGKLLIGLGDPARTGQALAIYGILYPMVGSHIEVTPDFGQRVLEWDFFVKGKITVFRFLKIAWALFFSRDLRRLLKLLKREAA